MKHEKAKVNVLPGTSKRWARLAISAAMVALIVALGVLLLSAATKRDASDFKYRPFFEEDTEYDVLFFGTSHVINGVFPMQLWKDYGITSYNFGGHGNSLAMSYWVMVNAIKEHKPKVAVLDAYFAGASGTSMSIGNSHLSMDAWPLSLAKMRAVKDVFPNNKAYQTELLFPFSVYHNRWNELAPNDIKRAFGRSVGSTKEKGAESRIQISVAMEMQLVPESEYKKENSVGLEYIQKFIDYCRENDVEPVIINIPYPADENNQLWANTAIKLAKEQGVPAVNFQYTDTVDFDIDCYDPNSHLNPSGAKKVTDALGKLLTSRFALEDKRKDPGFASWNEAYDEYYHFLVDNIKKHDSYPVSLMLVNNSNFSANLMTAANYEPSEVEQKLIAQLGGSLTRSHVVSIKTEDGDEADIKLTIYNKESGETIVTKYYTAYQQVSLVKKH